MPQWQIDAGGKLAFDVASIKANKTDQPPHANFSLDFSDSYPPNGGLFSVTRFPLAVYIGFAYKLPPYEAQALSSQLPKWALADRFDIQARSGIHPTKNQMRLMMQSLLADRFKLAVHTETRELPVFALVLAKPGKVGPQLRPHSDNPPCATLPTPGSTPIDRTTTELAMCGGLIADVVSGRMSVFSRNLTMVQIANYLPVVGKLDREVVDQTGLAGTFDFAMDASGIPAPPGREVQPDANPPTFLESLRDQLGLKLESKKAPVDVLVIDHVEEPTPN